VILIKAALSGFMISIRLSLCARGIRSCPRRSQERFDLA